MYLRAIARILVLMLVLSSCQRDIEGVWKLNYVLADRQFAPDYLIIEEGAGQVIDGYGIVHHFPKVQVQDDSLILRNSFQEISLSIDSLRGDLLQLDSLGYVPISSKENFPVTIELLGLRADLPYYVPGRIGAYNRISIKEVQPEGLVLKLGDRIASFKDLPPFLICTDCEYPREARLVVDQGVSYANFKAVMFHLRMFGVQQVFIILQSNTLGSYQGLPDRINLWDEDLARLSADWKMPPPPPLWTRNGYLSTFEKITFVKADQLEDFDKVQALLNKGEKAILVDLDQLNSVADYVTIKLKAIKLLDEIKNQLAQENYGKDFRDLSLEEKMAVMDQMPILNFEISTLH